MRTLDRSKKFATSYGETDKRFYQDGVYFTAQGEEVPADPPQEQREAPPLGAGKPVGKVLPGAASTQVDASGGPAPPAVSSDELRAQLASLNFGQVKKLFTKADGPPELGQGAGSVARMVDWLVANSAKAAE